MGSDERRDDQGLFGAAYENVVYRDSTRDGNEGDTFSGDEPPAKQDRQDEPDKPGKEPAKPAGEEKPPGK